MNEIVLIQQAIRNNLIAILDQYSLPELTKIPNGFANNIFWNIAHVASTQQLLCYFLSNTPMRIDKFWIDNFRKGTKPDVKIEKENALELKEILLKQPIDFLNDFNKNNFGTYKPYLTSFGVTLNTVEDATRYNLSHEGLHLGYIMAMKKLV